MCQRSQTKALWPHAVLLSSLHVRTYVCVSSSCIRLQTDGRLLISQSCSQTEQHTWMVRLAALVWPEPSSASNLHSQLFNSVSFHSLSFTSLRPKPHSWPNMAWSHQSDASGYLRESLRCSSDTTAMGAEEKKMKKTPIAIAPPGFFLEQWDERSQTRSFLVFSWFGPKPQELGFTARSPSRTDVTSAG